MRLFFLLFATTQYVSHHSFRSLTDHLLMKLIWCHMMAFLLWFWSDVLWNLCNDRKPTLRCKVLQSQSPILRENVNASLIPWWICIMILYLITWLQITFLSCILPYSRGPNKTSTDNLSPMSQASSQIHKNGCSLTSEVSVFWFKLHICTPNFYL